MVTVHGPNQDHKEIIKNLIFEKSLTEFYRKCGFDILCGGIVDFKQGQRKGVL